MPKPNTLRHKRVVVTGGCGFIGINLVHSLLDQGADVTIIDVPNAKWDRIPKGATRIQVDILNKQQLKNTLQGCEILYHLAARTDLDGTTLDAYAVNFEGTHNLIREAAKTSSLKRFVFYSTQLVVGLFNETRFIDENEPYKTNTVYGQSKIEGEKVVMQECPKAGIEYVIIRPTSVYGPWGEAPYKDFFKTIKNRRYLHVGKAANLVSWAYVKNLVDQTIHLSLHEGAKNQVFFGTDFHPYTMREIVNEVAAYYKISVPTIPNALITLIAYSFAPLKAVGLPVPIYPFRLKNIKANYCYDIQNSVYLGYRPRYDLRAGIRETLDWYERNNYF